MTTRGTPPPKGGLYGAHRRTQTRYVNMLHAHDGGARAGRALRLPVLTGALLWTSMLRGCSGSPSRNILGSYVASWMVCALIGLAMALVARAVLKATGLLSELPAPLVVLLSIGCAMTFALWLFWLA